MMRAAASSLIVELLVARRPSTIEGKSGAGLLMYAGTWAGDHD